MNIVEKLNISLLVGLKNNLEYSQCFYNTTRQIYPDAEIVFVSYGSTDGTHEWLDSLSDNNLKYYYSSDSKSLADTYNKCIEIATQQYVVLLHNDMVLTSNFLENISKHLDENTVVGYSFIEPPIYAGDERVGKIVEDFGIDIQSLQLNDLYTFSKDTQIRLKDKTENKIELRFFLSLRKELLLSIRGFDNLFSPMFFEDDDLFLRLEQLNLKMITSLDAICYHFVSKTSRFSEEVIKRTKLIEENSQRNFSRKWGFPSYTDKTKVYDVAIILKNATIVTIRKTEPYCTQLYTDSDFTDYIKEEQGKTKIDLSGRILPFTSLSRNKHQVVVEINGEKLDDKSAAYVKRINGIINKRKNASSFKKVYYSIFSRNKIRKGSLLIRVQI